MARYVGGEDGGVHCIWHDRHARGAEARAEDLNDSPIERAPPKDRRKRQMTSCRRGTRELAERADDIMLKGHKGARRKGAHRVLFAGVRDADDMVSGGQCELQGSLLVMIDDASAKPKSCRRIHRCSLTAIHHV